MSTIFDVITFKFCPRYLGYSNMRGMSDEMNARADSNHRKEKNLLIITMYIS